ncbi:MAG: MFS transporter [Bifidobacterium sp.]|nr:MFS transporter [Bifidobacterium sp.]
MSAVTTKASGDPYANPETSNKAAIRALILLLITFILGTLCVQGFNLVFNDIGKQLGAPDQASLITAIPGIVLGIVAFIYGSISDFMSVKKLTMFGLICLFVGSAYGFIANFFFEPNLWNVIIGRMIQTAGAQVAGSVFLVVATKYLKDSLKVVFFGLFTAGYQFSAAIGVFAAGLLSSIAWQWLFLIPAVTIVFLPFLMKSLPDAHSAGSKIDWVGFIIFGLAVAFLTIFFSYINQWWLLIVAIVLFICFGVYINKANDPFITPAFFKNKRWLMAISLILVFYFVNYCISPIYNAIGGAVYNMTTAQVSAYLVWAFVVATIVGTSSGAIVGKIGQTPAIITAGCLMAAGFIGAACCVSTNFLVLTLWACVFYAGCGLLYSPVVATVLGTLPVEQSGRGIGMNDLVMNVTASIGIAIFGTLMGNGALNGSSFVGTTGVAAGYSNLLLIGGAVLLLGVIIFLCIRKTVYKGETKAEEHEVDAPSDGAALQ